MTCDQLSSLAPTCDRYSKASRDFQTNLIYGGCSGACTGISCRALAATTRTAIAGVAGDAYVSVAVCGEGGEGGEP